MNKTLICSFLLIILALTTGRGLAFHAPILGICEDYPRGTMYDEIERDFELLARYGIKDLRISIAWGDVEFFKDYFDWDLIDDTVDLAEQYGIELYPYICYSPTWATRAAWRSPPEDLQDWYDFVYAVVERYGDRIDHWELWNEGDNEEFWAGTWEEQLDLVSVGAQAVKDANPKAKTIFGGLTNLSPSHVKTIFTSGAAENIDILNIHFYNETWNSTPTEYIYNTTQQVVDVIKEYGSGQELWVAEIGYSDYVREDGYVSYYVRARLPYEKTQAFQAVTFARQVTQLFAIEEVSSVLWYEVKNLPLGSAAIGDVNNHYLGALDFDYYPKPLFFALTNFIQLFDEPVRAISAEQLKISAPEGVVPHVYAFNRENGDTLLVAWKRGVEKAEIAIEGLDLSGTIMQYSVTGNKVIVDDLASITLDPADLALYEIVRENNQARLSLSNIKINQSEAGYTVTALCKNIGGTKSEGIAAELFPSKELDLLSAAIIDLPGLEAGAEVEVEWEVERVSPGGEARVWIVVQDQVTPPAAKLIHFKGAGE